MKREIKFRVWNGMEMVYDITTGKFGTFYVNPENGDGLNPKDTASLKVNTTKYHDGTTLMQFTGLVDKNSVEIYEGDICKDSGGRLLLVGWSMKFASFILDNKKWAFRHWFGESCDPENVEVIGNIHKNPELVNEAI